MEKKRVCNESDDERIAKKPRLIIKVKFLLPAATGARMFNNINDDCLIGSYLKLKLAYVHSGINICMRLQTNVGTPIDTYTYCSLTTC
jgi:hypothetical protein